LHAGSPRAVSPAIRGLCYGVPLIYCLLLILAAGIPWINQAVAESTTIGVETLFERDPSDLSEAKNFKFNVNAAHEFANAVVLGGYFEPEINKSSVWTYNLEGTLGYGFKLTSRVSLSGSAGVGDRKSVASSGGDFPYYALRARLDIDLSDRWSWNLITYRFRNAFETRNNYNTPQVSTTITLKLDASSSIYTKYFYDWENGPPSDQGFALGYNYRF